MPAVRKRMIVDDAGTPLLPRHVRLQFDELRKAWAVLAPERVYWPDGTSIGILQKCDGETSVAQIISSLAKDYDASAGEVGPDVIEFLQEWSDKQLVGWRAQA